MKLDDVDADTLKAVTEKVFPVQNDAAGEEMQATIAAAKENADSVGGVIECAVVGLPVGVGEPMFDGLESRLAAAIYAIPAVKGVEFGEGFGVAALFGSENNDNFTYQADGYGSDNNEPSRRLSGRHFERHAPCAAGGI